MSQLSSKSGLKQGVIDGLPLLGGYIPVAISFGVIAVQAGFSTLEATLISVFIYAGASQFSFGSHGGIRCATLASGLYDVIS